MVTPSDEHRFFHVAIRLTLMSVGLASVLSLFSDRHWIAELFSHFRMYYVLALALLALIFLHTQHRVLLMLALLLVIPNAISVFPYLTPLVIGRTIAEQPGRLVSIVAINVNYRGLDHEPLLEYLDSVSPDLVVVAEYTPEWETDLEVLDAEYPYRIGQSRADPWGLAVFSRIPFARAELLDLGVEDTVHANFLIDLDGTPVEIFAVHLMVPTSRSKADMRNRQLAVLAEQVSVAQNPILVVGDLNITPFSPLFDDFLAATGLVDARQPFGIHGTWPTNALPIWIPIDHCLADPRIPIERVATGAPFGSDHFPLEIVIRDSFGG